MATDKNLVSKKGIQSLKLGSSRLSIKPKFGIKDKKVGETQELRGLFERGEYLKSLLIRGTCEIVNFGKTLLDVSQCV